MPWYWACCHSQDACSVSSYCTYSILTHPFHPAVNFNLSFGHYNEWGSCGCGQHAGIYYLHYSDAEVVENPSLKDSYLCNGFVLSYQGWYWLVTEQCRWDGVTFGCPFVSFPHFNKNVNNVHSLSLKAKTPDTTLLWLAWIDGSGQHARFDLKLWRGKKNA